MKKSKFELMVKGSHKDILDSRANLIIEDAKFKLEDEVRLCNNKVREAQRQIQDLSDFAPTSTISLIPSSGNFDASSWAKELLKAKMELAILLEEEKIAAETLEEFFGITEED